MSDLLAARFQMGMSLAFHIIFAVVGIAMPVMMVLAERRWRNSGDPIYLDLAKRWSRGTAILFAVGAVSGTVLSFELGLLWPTFMRFAGAIIGMPFSLEGFAFFTEAIFLGIYLYGWERVSARAHQFAGIMVAVSGALSGVFVVTANAWMNTPTGFDLVNGVPVNVHPVAAMLNGSNRASRTNRSAMTLTHASSRLVRPSSPISSARCRIRPSDFVSSVTTARCSETSMCTTRFGAGCATHACGPASNGVQQR